MQIGGLLRTSFSDFPGRVAAVVYTRGCNFRCPYCHNPELIDCRPQPTDVDQDQVLAFLEQRRAQLDGVVVTGGEPTLQPDLEQFLGSVRALGLEIKLDTNGSRPRMLRRIIEAGLVDMTAIDLKAPLKRYQKVAGTAIDPAWCDAQVCGQQVVRRVGRVGERHRALPGIVAQLGHRHPRVLEAPLIALIYGSQVSLRRLLLDDQVGRSREPKPVEV